MLVSSPHLGTHVRMESWERGLSPQTPQSLSSPHSEGYSPLGGTAMACTVAAWRREPIQALARRSSCRPSIVRCSDFFLKRNPETDSFLIESFTMPGNVGADELINVSLIPTTLSYA